MNMELKRLLNETLESVYEYGWILETKQLCLCMLDTVLDVRITEDIIVQLFALCSVLRAVSADNDIKFMIRMRELENKLLRLSSEQPLMVQQECCVEQELERNPEGAIYRKDPNIVKQYKIKHKNDGVVDYIETVTEYKDGTKESTKEYIPQVYNNPTLYNQYARQVLKDDITE